MAAVAAINELIGVVPVEHQVVSAAVLEELEVVEGLAFDVLEEDLKRVKLLGSKSQVVDELQGSWCLAERAACAGVEDAGVELRVWRGQADVNDNRVLSRSRGVDGGAAGCSA